MILRSSRYLPLRRLHSLSGLIPLGTKLSIPGYGEGVAADTGGAVRGPTIDLWFPTIAQALAWGRRTVTITLR